MFSDVLEEVTSTTGNRFIMTALFPSLIFWGLLITVLIIGSGNLSVAVNIWNGQDGILKSFQIVGFIAWVTFFASILSSQSVAILRFYEGYWKFPMSKKLGDRGIKKHKRKLKKISVEMTQNKNRYEDIYLFYPLPTQPEQVMPTLLGNILKNSELYPYDRYNIDAVLIWPRLYHILPGSFIQTIAEARGSLDFMLRISFLSGSFALLCFVFLFIALLLPGRAIWWFIFVFLCGGLLVAWLAYKSSLGSAVLYAHQIKSAFDLYRRELLRQMNFSLPTTLKDEQDLWEEICLFLYRNIPGKF
ncbi:hypothetical protein FXV91_17290 [Methanosarcina sp. DH2]|uniref:hypothetical protein n=1 Tax=Methanosarcina sp. DH2 TaxID=2605639 RepID=UPI001E4C6973|nr:hypothetical protein [Methanosarcina sp. DH2]MCC4771854.1 hypothetical protein [Methanosarcina sp. DH2]